LVCPGFVRTPLGRQANPRTGQGTRYLRGESYQGSDAGRDVDKEFTRSEDIAEVALMLAAFQTNALTGQSIIASHGWHMN